MNKILLRSREITMSSRGSWPVALAFAIVMAGTANVPALAQSATPAAVEVSSTCSLAPLDLPLLGGTPAAAFLATPAVASIDLANLAPLDPETEAAVRDGVANLVACMNTGEPRRAYAIFTTAFLAENYGDPTRAYLPAFEQALDAAPAPLPSPYGIDALTIKGEVPDGRVVISLTVSTDGTAWTSTLVLQKVNGAWLIDAVLP